MKKNIHLALAYSAIRKNRMLYIPYLISCSAMAVIFYIISYLAFSKSTEQIPGASVIIATLFLGMAVYALFSFLFLSYTNNFLNKKRQKEYGLYNVLGMSKRDIHKVVFYESLLSYIITIVAGLGIGVVLSKLFELMLYNLVKYEISMHFEISITAVLATVGYFAFLFFLLFLKNCRKINRMSAVEIISEAAKGEKAPKSNAILALGGTALLLYAYYLASTCDSAVVALLTFFIAVDMVVIATYLIFISGSVFVCNLLSKNKKVYYKIRNFISISSLKFRMKRNGAGLASICILSTMALVTIATTSCLYFGEEDSLKANYPREISQEILYDTYEQMNEEYEKDYLGQLAVKYCEPTNILKCSYIRCSGYIDNGEFESDSNVVTSMDIEDTAKVYTVYYISTQMFNSINNSNLIQNDDEMVLYCYGKKLAFETFHLKGGYEYKVVNCNDDFAYAQQVKGTVIPNIYLIVNDPYTAVYPYSNEQHRIEGGCIYFCNSYLFDFTEEQKNQAVELGEAIRAELSERYHNQEVFDYFLDNRVLGAEDFYSTYGSLFFLGIVLSVSFLMATVLIIYYKQVSEGFEDQSRFDIMSKVGLNKKEIRESIASQMIAVFFLPALLAMTHLVFAFPMMKAILSIFGFTYTTLFVRTCIISCLAFVGMYVGVYTMTSNAYYKIVTTISRD